MHFLYSKDLSQIKIYRDYLYQKFILFHYNENISLPILKRRNAIYGEKGFVIEQIEYIIDNISMINSEIKRTLIINQCININYINNIISNYLNNYEITNKSEFIKIE